MRSVTATNTETNVRTTTSTNPEGLYTFPFLRVGPYTITVEAKGFKKSVVGPFPVEANQIARIDVKLELGDTSVTVEVTGVAAMLQTETQATGDTLTSSEVDQPAAQRPQLRLVDAADSRAPFPPRRAQ